jgi:hypothetical protein
MAFRTDGSVHYEGIANEDNLKIRLETYLARLLWPNLEDDFTVNHRGGTKFKQDVEVQDQNSIRLISAKRKKSIASGSFDYINTSRPVNEETIFEPIRELSRSLRNEDTSVSRARRLFNETAHGVMREMSGETLKRLLKEYVADKNENIMVIITDSTTNTDYAFNFKDTPLYNAICNYTPQFRWGRGKTSAKIVFRDSQGDEHDFGLRGRLVLNNGVRALLGLSSANKSSQAVFKVQQDKVAKMLSQIPTLQTFKENQ